MFVEAGRSGLGPTDWRESAQDFAATWFADALMTHQCDSRRSRGERRQRPSAEQSRAATDLCRLLQPFTQQLYTVDNIARAIQTRYKKGRFITARAGWVQIVRRGPAQIRKSINSGRRGEGKTDCHRRSEVSGKAGRGAELDSCASSPDSDASYPDRSRSRAAVTFFDSFAGPGASTPGGDWSSGVRPPVGRKTVVCCDHMGQDADRSEFADLREQNHVALPECVPPDSRVKAVMLTEIRVPPIGGRNARAIPVERALRFAVLVVGLWLVDA